MVPCGSGGARGSSAPWWHDGASGRCRGAVGREGHTDTQVDTCRRTQTHKGPDKIHPRGHVETHTQTQQHRHRYTHRDTHTKTRENTQTCTQGYIQTHTHAHTFRKRSVCAHRLNPVSPQAPPRLSAGGRGVGGGEPSTLSTPRSCCILERRRNATLMSPDGQRASSRSWPGLK